MERDVQATWTGGEIGAAQGRAHAHTHTQVRRGGVVEINIRESEPAQKKVVVVGGPVKIEGLSEYLHQLEKESPIKIMSPEEFHYYASTQADNLFILPGDKTAVTYQKMLLRSMAKERELKRSPFPIDNTLVELGEPGTLAFTHNLSGGVVQMNLFTDHEKTRAATAAAEREQLERSTQQTGYVDPSTTSKEKANKVALMGSVGTSCAALAGYVLTHLPIILLGGLVGAVVVAVIAAYATWPRKDRYGKSRLGKWMDEHIRHKPKQKPGGYD